jgi:DNA-binding transcriptional MerR regulator
MFKIGDFSKLCRVPVSALRYYADIGLLEPAQIDRLTGFRYYGLEQLPRLYRILALKDLGLSLTQIARLLQADLSVSELQGMLKLREQELQQEVALAQERLQQVRSRLQHLERHEHGLPPPEVIVKEIPAQPIIARRAILPNGDAVADLFMAVVPQLIAQGIEVTHAPLTLFHDGEFKATDLDVEIAFPVAKLTPLPATSALQTRILDQLPQAAVLLHVGDYARFPETYAQLAYWLTQQHYQMAGSIREVYLRAPSEGAAITEIQVPIVKEQAHE